MIPGRKPRPRRGRIGGASGPRCPPHLSGAAAREWRRLAPMLHKAGLLTTADRAAFAAYCSAWGRWVEAEEALAKTPLLLKTPSGYVQQSPWLSIANKQLELMARAMAELGLTPTSRARLGHEDEGPAPAPVKIIIISPEEAKRLDQDAKPQSGPAPMILDSRL